jgi:hypothetical protein
MRWLEHILRKLTGRTEKLVLPTEASAPPVDDFVARYGRAYGEPADPVSYNAKVEVAKALRRPNTRYR